MKEWKQLFLTLLCLFCGAYFLRDHLYMHITKLGNFIDFYSAVTTVLVILIFSFFTVKKTQWLSLCLIGLLSSHAFVHLAFIKPITFLPFYACLITISLMVIISRLLSKGARLRVNLEIFILSIAINLTYAVADYYNKNSDDTGYISAKSIGYLTEQINPYFWILLIYTPVIVDLVQLKRKKITINKFTKDFKTWIIMQALFYLLIFGLFSRVLLNI